jgi:hypothetical protein
MNAAARAEFRDQALQWIRERSRIEGRGASIDSHSAAGDDGSAAVVIIDREGEPPVVLSQAFGDGGNSYEQGLLAIAADTVEYITQMRAENRTKT